MGGAPGWGEVAGLFPYIWTPAYGFNFDMLFNYFVLMLVGMFPTVKAVAWLVQFVKTQVNKIKFKIPVVGYTVDFNEYVWDDKFFDDIGAALQNKMLAKQSDVRRLKLKYRTQVAAAGGDPEKLSDIIDKSQRELQDVTEKLILEMRTEGDALLWSALETRMSDEGKAVKWMRDRVKALVEKQKNGSAQPPNLLGAVSTALIEGIGESGNGSSVSEELNS